VSEDSRAPSAARPRTLVFAFRILLLLLAAGAVAIALFLSRIHDRAAGDSGARYVCPMHPEVTSTVPGECPVCHMQLEVNANDPGAGPTTIAPSTYLNYEIMRRRGTGPDAPAPAWVQEDGAVSAILYRDEIDGLTLQSGGLFFPAGAPREGIEIQALSESAEPWDRSTSRVRFHFDARRRAVPGAGEVGWVRLKAKARDMPVIPYSAILEAADGPYVLVASSDGRTLTKRSVEIGKVFGGLTFVLSGLRSQERVLVRSAFFVDAERRLHRDTAIEVAQ
jgi:hypothetical protein